jgi:histone-lysine N-methyltransferase SETMAR
VTIAWNLFGFHVFEALPKGRTFDAEYYHDSVLTALVSLRPKGGERKLAIHADNSRAVGIKTVSPLCQNGLGLATHPPYSPDIAPSDFLLFGHVKHCLQRMGFASHEEVFTAIGEIVTDIPKEILHLVFDHWMERLEWVSQHKGDYHP